MNKKILNAIAKVECWDEEVLKLEYERGTWSVIIGRHVTITKHECFNDYSDTSLSLDELKAIVEIMEILNSEEN